MVARTEPADKRELDHLGELRGQAEALRAFVEQAANEGQPAHEVESGIWQRILSMGREALGAFFARQGTGDLGERVTLDDGREAQRLDHGHARSYRSIFGEFTLHRTVYGSREKQKQAWVPLDQRLQLPESGYSYVLQDWAQSLGVEHAFGPSSRTLERILGQAIPVDSLERMNRQMAQDVADYRAAQPMPSAAEEGPIVVATADNKGVPMRRAAEQTPAGARRGKGEKANKKRMATVGAVYTMQPKLRTPQAVVEALFRERSKPGSAEVGHALHKRVWSSLDTEHERGQDRVLGWIAGQVGARVGSAGQELPCIMDGQDSLWKDARSHLAGYQVVEILDLLHVTSRVWDAAHVFYAEGSSEATAFARARIEAILEGKVGRVIGGMRQMATKRRLSASKRKRLETICRYLQNNRHRMRYDEYLARGYPIATGVIEGACRYVVKDRMERAGMRWSLQGAQAMLDLRTTHVNGQWNEFQTYRIERERERLYPNKNALANVEWPLAA